MSKGLGKRQWDVLEALAKHPERDYSLALYMLKRELWGTRPRVALVGAVIIHAGLALKAQPEGAAANLNRAIASLEERGLVEQTREWNGYRYHRHIRLCPRVISDYKDKVVTYGAACAWPDDKPKWWRPVTAA